MVLPKLDQLLWPVFFGQRGDRVWRSRVDDDREAARAQPTSREVFTYEERGGNPALDRRAHRVRDGQAEDSDSLIGQVMGDRLQLRIARRCPFQFVKFLRHALQLLGVRTMVILD